MSRWEYSGKIRKKERIEVPFAKQAASREYYYFDLNHICREMNVSREICEEARRLSRDGAVELKSVQTRHTPIYYGGESLLVATGVAADRGQSLKISLSFTKYMMYSIDCGCPGCYFANYVSYDGTGDMCVHAWALMYLIEDYIIRYNPGDATRASTVRLMNDYRQNRVSETRSGFAKERETLRLAPRLEHSSGILSASFKAGTDRLYVVKDLTRFVEQVNNGETAKFGKSTVIDYANCNLDEHSKLYFAFIKGAVNEELGRQRQLMMRPSTVNMAESFKIRGKIPLLGGRIDEFYDIIREEKIEYTDRDADDENRKKKMIKCKKAKPAIELTLNARRDDKGNFEGVMVMGQIPPLIEGSRGFYSVSPDGYLNEADMEEMHDLLPIYRISDISGEVYFNVGRKYMSEFYYTLLPILRNYGKVNEPDAKEIDSYLAPEVSFKFYIDADDENIGCKVESCYGDKAVRIMDVFDEEKREKREDWRDMRREDEAADKVLNYFPAIDTKEQIFHCARDEDAVYKVLSQGINDLMSMGEVHCTKKFRRLQIRSKTKIMVGVSVKSNLMDLSISSDISYDELMEALESYRRKKKYFRLKNGDFLKIDEPGIEALSEMMEAMHVTPGEFVRGKMQVPVYRSLYLDKMLEKSSGIYAKRDSHFRQIVKGFKTVEDSDFEVPESLSQTLRTYQMTGYKWIRTLAAYEFGGILADDMGLGKTIQMIAAFVSWKEEGAPGGDTGDSRSDCLEAKDPCLVVCPVSLTYNWLEEMTRFSPQLEVGLVVGARRDRREMLSHYAEYDVLVTSYDSLKRDIDQYENCHFLCEVLDEAQFIKNPSTAAAKSVKLIKSRYRFALTGTPIENRLSELWSIFDYLMPGFLYEYRTFKKEFETPIVKSEDEAASARLRRMVSPFIMRRLKKDVLKDLPDKIEKVHYAKFDSPQQRLYDAQTAHMQKLLCSQDEEAFSKEKIKILAELTRIRQICCDPSLIYEDYKDGSAKREACLDLVCQAVEGGHQMLIFSQFTSMLALIEEDLTAEGIRYYKITGGTPKKERLEMVHAFNEDGTPVFLISLKAGGTGLNLIGADIVIHYDPWWNIAAQNQATDRTHRIGQTQVVSVYRLIVKGSIEERILKMQEDKKDLAEEILSTENTGLGSMSRDELMELLDV